MFKRLIKNIASKLGFTILSAYDQNKRKEYQELIESFANVPLNKTDSSCVLIIFSRDRAMQLDALLQSYFYFVKNPCPVKVLYSSSNEDFEQSYRDVQAALHNKAIEFIRENDFRNDLIHLFDRLDCSKVLFLVDDILFKADFDFEAIQNINAKEHIFSLRHGKHLNYAYTVQKAQSLPQLNQSKVSKDLLQWDWEKAEHDWAYPLSVDGHLFDASEMKILVNQLNYKAPNSFEAAMQVVKPFFSKREGLCYEKSIIVNNPCNIVQTENNNFHGEVSVEDLNKKWKEGYSIDFKVHEGILNKSVHEELALTFAKR